MNYKLIIPNLHKYEFREYYRDRPRGEFLTRGAALSSQNTTQPGRLAQVQNQFL